MPETSTLDLLVSPLHWLTSSITKNSRFPKDIVFSVSGNQSGRVLIYKSLSIRATSSIDDASSIWTAPLKNGRNVGCFLHRASKNLEQNQEPELIQWKKRGLRWTIAGFVLSLESGLQHVASVSKWRWCCLNHPTWFKGDECVHTVSTTRWTSPMCFHAVILFCFRAFVPRSVKQHQLRSCR